MIFVLIQADEGWTSAVFVSQGPDLSGLRTVVDQVLTADIATYPLPWSTEYHGHGEAMRDALLRMIDAHTVLIPGRYVLPSIEPQWQQWLLLIADHDAGVLMEHSLYTS